MEPITIHTYENACLQLQNTTIKYNRNEAENIILLFRQNPNVINDSLNILQNTKNNFLQFQTALALKDGIIRCWTLMSYEEQKLLRSTIVNLILNVIYTYLLHIIY